MKAINIFFNLIICILFVNSIFSQDYAITLKTPAVYTQYHLNPFLINPAHTGFENKASLLFNFRNQWAGFDEAPKGLTFAINAAPANNMGLGALIYAENYGVANRFIGQGNYAYNFRAGENRLAIGIAGRYLQYSLDNEVLTDPLHQGPDPIINEALDGQRFFTADLGFWAEIAKKYRVGISIPHLVETRLDNTKNDTNQDKQVNFTAFLGAVWDVPDYRISLEPSVGLRKIGDVPFGTDLNILARLLDDKLYAGFTYSFGPSWHRTMFLAGARIDKLRFYYSYDQTYLDFQTFNNGSHELTLSFDLYSLTPKTRVSQPMDTDNTEGNMNEETKN
ncbi:MAG: PorP/SprF family type IX secretion system membrane protein [Bacteroidota bacterium]|nr:PorP/SprF family type IX secretion system membrane protein [Bacteroidota bacterium]